MTVAFKIPFCDDRSGKTIYCQHHNKQSLMYSFNCPCARHESISGSEGKVSYILNAGTRGVVSFTSWPHYPHGHSPQHLLNMKLSGSQSWSGCFGEEMNLWPLPGMKWFLGQPVA